MNIWDISGFCFFVFPGRYINNTPRDSNLTLNNDLVQCYTRSCPFDSCLPWICCQSSSARLCDLCDCVSLVIWSLVWETWQTVYWISLHYHNPTFWDHSDIFKGNTMSTYRICLAFHVTTCLNLKDRFPAIMFLQSYPAPYRNQPYVFSIKNYRTPCVCHKKVKVSVAQLYLTLCDPMNCSQPGSSVHGILQARILEWVAIPFSRGSSRPKG